MKNRIKKIFKLENGQKYLVVKQAVYREESYCVTIGVTEDEKDFTEELVFFKEITKDDKTYMEKVEDPRLIEVIAKYVGLINSKDVENIISELSE